MRQFKVPLVVGGVAVALLLLAVIAGATFAGTTKVSYSRLKEIATLPIERKLDEREYDERLLMLAHLSPPNPWYYAYLSGTTTPIDKDGNATTTTTKKPMWPARRAYPNYGALLPFNRIVAYYGNFYSRQMGALGEYDPDDMLVRLKAAAAEWEAADPETPVIPAIHYIVETAQAGPTKTGLYMARMPDTQVDKALDLATQIDGIVFLDFQVGFSTIQKELPFYEKYWMMPNVHVGIDPEFSMKGSASPGHVVGTYDASDINDVAEYLAKIVRDNNLPPKILIVHRFTQAMMTNAHLIKPLPEVQIVIDMDGWGSPAKKESTYVWIVADEPVQFTGFKIFYKNDLKPPSERLMTPREVLELTPSPIYIQYQ